MRSPEAAPLHPSRLDIIVNGVIALQLVGLGALLCDLFVFKVMDDISLVAIGMAVLSLVLGSVQHLSLHLECAQLGIPDPTRDNRSELVELCDEPS